MTGLYSARHREFQDMFDTRRLADALEQRVMQHEIAGQARTFIETSDFFFLSTVDHNGWPTVSYKGGAAGFVRVIDDKTLAFPCYDGNGMFYSMGNIADNARIGMLFIDFETPRRLRVHGTAQVSADDPLLRDYHEACLVVRVAIENLFINCARYIHRYQRVDGSEFVPEKGAPTPVPSWKRVDAMQPALPQKDREAARNSGPLITPDDYREKFWRGLD